MQRIWNYISTKLKILIIIGLGNRDLDKSIYPYGL
jgi:hypothetical protein